MSEVIVGDITGTIEVGEQDLSPASAAGFNWLHFQGNHSLRVKDGALI